MPERPASPSPQRSPVAVAPRTAPFPWARLALLRRADVEAARALRRAGARLDVRAVAHALGEIVKARVEIRLVRGAQAEAPAFADDFVGVVLAAAGERSPARRVLVELEGALAASLCARALGHAAPAVADASRPPPPPIAGATGAIVHAALRRATRDVPLRVLSAGPGAALARDLLSATSGVTAWLAVSVDGAAFAARVTVAGGLAADANAAIPGLDLASLGDLPLALSVVATQTTLTPLELDALAPGDALVLGTSALTWRGAPGFGPEGRVALVAPRSERGAFCDLADEGRLVLREGLAQHPWTARAFEGTRSEDETAMGETSSTTQTSLSSSASAALEDAPVVVRVELGVVEMTARAWSELGPGDVVTLGKRAGEPVVLRAAGVEIARGELVQVDGEIGVRILARSGGGA
jgi:type III secretion system YscQ/HrcQ family protein